MRTELHHEIEIDASPEAVWQVVAKTEYYGVWNPFIRELHGSLEPGAKLNVRITPPGGRAMTFKPTVLAATPARELRWRGRLGVRGLFDGEHILRIEPLGDGRTRFVQAEVFTGVLVRPLRKGLGATGKGFEAMNAALKARVECFERHGVDNEVCD